MELADKVAIVTGGASGIGQMIATVLAENGATVAIADLLEDVGKDTAQELEKQGFTAGAFPVDVSDPGQVERLVQRVVETYGAVDILVNNAGIGQRQAILDQIVHLPVHLSADYRLSVGRADSISVGVFGLPIKSVTSSGGLGTRSGIRSRYTWPSPLEGTSGSESKSPQLKQAGALIFSLLGTLWLAINLRAFHGRPVAESN